jgi:hypothetical protein
LEAFLILSNAADVMPMESRIRLNIAFACLTPGSWLLSPIFEIPESESIAAAVANTSAPAVFNSAVSGFPLFAPLMTFSISDFILLVSKSSSRLESAVPVLETVGFAEQENKKQPAIAESKKIEIFPMFDILVIKWLI